MADWSKEEMVIDMFAANQFIIFCGEYWRVIPTGQGPADAFCTAVEVQKLWKQFDKHENFKIEQGTQHGNDTPLVYSAW